MTPEVKKLIKELRTLVADYMSSEGCSCCRIVDRHEVNAERLAKALRVPKYKDGIGYNFSKYQSKKP